MSFTPIVPASSGGASPPAMLGLLLWTIPPELAFMSGNPPTGDVFFSLAQAAASGSVGHLGTIVRQAGVTPGAGLNAMAIYSAAGVLLGNTGDMTAQFEATGYVEGAITPVSIVAGQSYYLGISQNFTGTVAQFAGASVPVPTPAIRANYSPVYESSSVWPASFTPSGLLAASVATLLVTAGT
jgi:hypothetical protein